MPILINNKEQNIVQQFMMAYLLLEHRDKIESESPYYSRIPVETMYDKYIEYISEQESINSNILNEKAFVVVMESFFRVSLNLYNDIESFQFYAFSVYNYLMDNECYTKRKVELHKSYRQRNAETVSQRRKELYKQAKAKKVKALQPTTEIVFDFE